MTLRGFPAQLFFHLRFDRQPVAVPAGNIGRTESRHRLRLHDHVFQNFVQPGAQMDFAGGIGRPVVQHEKRRARARIEDAVIEPHLLPCSQLLRLALGQLRLHGEIGFWKIQRVFQVHFAGGKALSIAPNGREISVEWRPACYCFSDIANLCSAAWSASACYTHGMLQ